MIYGFGLLTMGVAWLLPGHYFPWTGFQQEFLAAAGLALVALSLLVPGGPRRLSVPPIALFALAFAVVPLLQWLAGRLPFATDAVLPTMYLCAFALAIVTGCALTRLRGGTFVAALMGAILAAGLASHHHHPAPDRLRTRLFPTQAQPRTPSRRTDERMRVLCSGSYS